MEKVTKEDIVQKFRVPLFCNWDGCPIHVGEQYVTELENKTQQPRYPSQTGEFRMHIKHLSTSQLLSGSPARFTHGG